MLRPLPPSLDPPNPNLAEAFMAEILSLAPDVVEDVESAGLKETLLFLLGSGTYIGGHLSRNPEWIREFLLAHDGLNPPNYANLFADLSSSEEEALAQIRKTKVKEHVRIGVRDLLWQSSVKEVLADLSSLADAVVEAMLQVAYRRCLSIYGEPKDRDGNTVPFSVIGLGKLGGNELNYHSDIDIIYVYGTEKGETTGPRVVNNHQFFVRLSELLTGYLSATTETGQCYKVDLRLRPEGSNGEITLPLLSYEIYYESYGREWERAMLVKARHVAGDEGLSNEFVNMLRPFVYRRYLDTTVIDSIREMKMRIDAEMCKRGSHLDVKLGKGGIREIEFVVNAIQLLNGGKRPQLRVRGTVPALEVIQELKLLPDGECQVLRDAYLFLRRLENRLQMVSCLQTHRLPENPEERCHIARMMGDYSSLDEFERDFFRHTEGVFQVYSDFFSRGDEGGACSILSSEGLEETLKGKGFSDVAASAAAITRLFLEPSVPLHSKLALTLAQRVIELASSTPDPDGAVEGLERIAQAWRESAHTFYALLNENRGLVELLLKIFGTSRYLTNVFVLNPGIMDYLEEPDFVEAAPSFEKLLNDIERMWELGGACTLEERAEVLREGILREVLRIGVGHLFHRKGVQWVSQRWTVLAQAVLHSLVDFMLRDGLLPQPLGVIGLGKLGSRELIYHSDLDLLFVSAEDPVPETQRAVSKLVKVLSAQTERGRLFEVDLRLRPYGEQGMVVTSLSTLERYLAKHARLWEFQAFTRSRGVAGDPEVQRMAVEVIHRSIYRDTPLEGMAEKVVEMRRRMEKELSKGSPYHLKYSPGGLVDVEFIIQYLRLLNGHRFKELRVAGSSFQALARLHRRGILSQDHYSELRWGYRFLRIAEMWLRILFDVPVSKLPDDSRRRLVLARAMGYQDETELLDDYLQHTSRIRAIFNGVLGVNPGAPR